MAKFVVTTPASDHTGHVGGVHFQNGMAEVNDASHAAELGYMRSAGYHVREIGPESIDLEAEPSAAEGSESVEAATARPKKTAPVTEWRTFAISKGLSAEEADGLTKNQLVERFDEEDAS